MDFNAIIMPPRTSAGKIGVYGSLTLSRADCDVIERVVADLWQACGNKNRSLYDGGELEGLNEYPRAAEDENIRAWVFNACATPYDATLRNPQIVPAMKLLCGQSVLLDDVTAVSVKVPP